MLVEQAVFASEVIALLFEGCSLGSLGSLGSLTHSFPFLLYQHLLFNLFIFPGIHHGALIKKLPGLPLFFCVCLGACLAFFLAISLAHSSSSAFSLDLCLVSCVTFCVAGFFSSDYLFIFALCLVL
jgi:hypothetical protein